MSSTRKILRAFLASPGDLQEERQAIRSVVAEFNESWADELGYQVELLGWEETVAGYGRPQHLINQEVDQCDLFIGMIWKRWGTPPSEGGEFTSGFHEEFERSMARRERSDRPEISLFFKTIPKDLMIDPGDDLKRVLKFREKIISKKKILFQNFSTIHDMEGLVRKCVTKYVNSVKATDASSESNEVGAVRTRSEVKPSEDKKKNPETSDSSIESFSFLSDFVSKIEDEKAMDNLSAFDIARFRLIANSISKPGNEELNLGVHDINLLFSARPEDVELSDREILFLVRLGFQHFSNENVPLWCWYSTLLDSRLDVAVWSSFTGANDEERIGAISVLNALSRTLPTEDEIPKREWIIDSWFSENTSTRVKSVALNYLARNGTAEDLVVARNEYDRNDHGTSRGALECMIGILLRIGERNSAQQLVLELQFESLDADMLQAILGGFEHLETKALLPGLEHRNAQVRLRTLRVLLERDSLDREMVERLLEDGDVFVRNEAIVVLSNIGRSFTQEEIENILIKTQRGMGLANYSVREKERTILTQHKLEKLKKLSEQELTNNIYSNRLHDNDAYFVRAEKYLAKYVEELRGNIDDTFSTYFEERMRRTETAFSAFDDISIGQNLINQYRELEDYLRKDLTRRGLDILCRASKYEDLVRIRNNIRDSYTGASKEDAKYLGKNGEWEDISLLANFDLSTYAVDYAASQDQVAKAILDMARRRSVSDLISIEMPAHILKTVIELCSNSRFSKISDDALLVLFNHESTDVRKTASIKAVQVFTAKRIRSILRAYISSDKYRYYNVIRWLDLGASMPRAEARKVTGAAAG